ncbi:MAG: adenylate/guanylate cyclase domain-containing protein [Paracoccaceae bacterium]
MTADTAELSEILVERVTAWLKRAALGNEDLERLATGVCDRLHAAGIPLMRAHLSFSVLHPLYGAVGFTWKRGEGVKVEGLRSSANVSSSERFLSSPYYHLLSHGLDHLRRRIRSGDTPEFPVFSDLQEMGATDYIAFAHLFDNEAAQGMMGSWTTDSANGFSESMIKALLRVQESLAVAAKMAVLSKLADNMMTTYLGGNAGRRVLSGQIRRGDGETMRAVLVMGDLRDSTALADRGGRQVYIDTLNQFFDAIASPFNGDGGEILSFVGDGFLAVYPCERHRDPSRIAAEAALRAVRLANARVTELNRHRVASGLEPVRFGLGLHIGNVMLGNVGLKQRLTFSAFGSAVNEVQRLESLTKKFPTQVVASEAFTTYTSGGWTLLGREALKGVRQKVAVYAPSSDLLLPDPSQPAGEDLGEARSDAEQVMLLYRDSRVQRPALLESIIR